MPPRECPPFACPCWGQQDGPSAPYHFPWQLLLGSSGFGGEPQLSPSVISREEGRLGRVSIALAPPCRGIPWVPHVQAGAAGRQPGERENRQHPSLGSQVQHLGEGGRPPAWHSASGPGAAARCQPPAGREGPEGAPGGPGPAAMPGRLLPAVLLAGSRARLPGGPPTLYFPFFNYSVQPH